VVVALTISLVLLALFDGARLFGGAVRAPQAADWSAAESAVRAGFAAGDLIVAAPRWADARTRLALGDLMPLAMVARPDADAFGRVWEVSVRGHTAPESRSPATCVTVLDGRVRVRRCDRPAIRRKWDLTARWLDARVLLARRGGPDQPCPYQGGRFVCPGGAAVTQVIGEIDYEPHRCILAPPAADGALIVEWPDVPLGRTLVGYSGIHSFYARKTCDAAPSCGDGGVEMSVRVGQGAPLRITHRNHDGWRRFELPTPGASAGGSPIRAPVRIEISSVHHEDRRFCFAAETRS
jgi:hypothetical protein